MKPISMDKILTDAKKGGYAVPAFNIDNLESALAVAEVLKEENLPLIVQTIPRTLRYGGVKTYPALMDALTDELNVTTPYAMHLDHGDSLDTVKKCTAAGFSSVMIDGSALALDDNIKLTKEAAAFAKSLGISVEGELGKIGGKEEGTEDVEASYTNVKDAVRFVAETGVGALAIGVGTAHGVYKGVPKINIHRIEEIDEAVNAALVLHGASGLFDEVVKAAVKAGIRKINFATELRQAYTAAIRRELASDVSQFDPKVYLRPAIDNIKCVLREKVKLCYGK